MSDSTAAPRERTFDIVKGLCILAVIFHHSSSYSARKHLDDHSGAWWATMLLNRFSHLAVPIFLFVSALLLARSVSKPGRIDWVRFYKRRTAGLVWPFVVWSVLYVLFRLYVTKTGADTGIVTRDWPLIGPIQGPNLVANPSSWVNILLWGKAYFHLYFMSVSLQLCLLFPLVVGVLKVRVPLGWFALLSVVLQAAWYLAQREVVHFFAPASLAFAYLVPILVGAWLGYRWKEASDVMAKARVWAWLAAVAGVTTHLLLAVQLFRGGRISTELYNGSFMVASAALGWILVAEAPRWQERKWAAAMARVGDASLALYLIHPMLLYCFGGNRATALFRSMPFPPAFVFLALTFASLLAVAAIVALRLDHPLFGRRFAGFAAPRRPKNVEEPEGSKEPSGSDR